MLVLTRRIRESIIINDNILITILQFNRNSVRLGINAPKDFSVHRAEIYKKILKENNIKHFGTVESKILQNIHKGD